MSDMWLTADTCHINVSKHGSDSSIVGGYISFPLCILCITMTVIQWKIQWQYTIKFNVEGKTLINCHWRP